jgi:hypothetical protein
MAVELGDTTATRIDGSSSRVMGSGKEDSRQSPTTLIPRVADDLRLTAHEHDTLGHPVDTILYGKHLASSPHLRKPNAPGLPFTSIFFTASSPHG